MAEGICAVDVCATPRRKRGWCDRHYQIWRRHGDPQGAKYEWAQPGQPCVVCGSSDFSAASRRYCSDACQVYASRQRRVQEVGGGRPEDRRCASCDVALNLRRRDGRATARGDTRFCAACRQKPRRSYRLAVQILAFYQGDVCRICNGKIDMTVRFPDKRCATVDHRVPLGLGGTDDVDNLQLAHYDCNCRRDAFFTDDSVTHG